MSCRGRQGYAGYDAGVLTDGDINVTVMGFSAPLAALVTLLAALADGEVIMGTASGFDALAPTGMFGGGEDGAATVGTGATLTLTDAKRYTNLTIQATGLLLNDGFPILVNGTLTLNGTIRDNGNSSVAGGGGAALAASGIRPPSGAGTAGRNTDGVGGNGGSSTASWWLGNWGTAPAGGAGGASGGGSNGGTGGTANATTLRIIATASWVLSMIATWTNPAGTTVRPPSVGGGGAAGGCTPGAGTATSGGGGSGGGVVRGGSRILTGSGTFEAKGGNGGDAASTGAGMAGGGGGGGGGLVLWVVEKTSSWTGTMSASGGTPGAGSNGGSSGSAGTDGKTLAITLFS